MLVLAINTASSKTGIALFERAGSRVKILAENSWPAKNNEAEKLMPAIDKLLKGRKKKYQDLVEIYVVKGPGTFTGLRVGVTVANTISALVDADLFGLTTFEFLHSQTDLPVLLFAGKGGVFLSEKVSKKPELVNLSELNQRLAAGKIFKASGDIRKEQIAVLNDVKFEKLKSNFGEVMKKIITGNVAKKNYKSVKLVKPVYIKEPGITMPKKQLMLS